MRVGTATDIVGIGSGHGWGEINLAGKDERIEVTAAHIDHGLLSVLDMQLVEGRFFDPSFETTSRANSVILNETAARSLGKGQSVIGSRIDDSAGRTSTVVGVVEDFHYGSLHDKIGPFAFFWYPTSGALVMKLRGQEVDETLGRVTTAWRNTFPTVPLDFFFLDDRIRQQYAAEESFRSLFSWMTTLSLIVAALGMLGLAVSAAEQRTHEVGIRKTLGATALEAPTVTEPRLCEANSSGECPSPGPWQP